MKIFFTFLTLLLFVFLEVSQAAPIRRLYQDVKLPNQAVIEMQAITNPGVAGTADILSAFAGNTATTAVTRTTFVANPDVPRNLVITPGSTTADVAACDVVVNGTNFFNDSISETFAFADNASSATTGAKAFKTVTSVVFPANCEDTPFTATWSIGYGEKLGLKRCMAEAGAWSHSSINGAKEATAATVVADTNEVEKNTADFNGTMNQSNDFKAYFIQNFGCFP